MNTNTRPATQVGGNPHAPEANGQMFRNYSGPGAQHLLVVVNDDQRVKQDLQSVHHEILIGEVTDGMMRGKIRSPECLNLAGMS